MKNLIPVGTLFVFLGMILIIIGALTQAQTKDQKSSAKVAVGGFIGFIPFGFANDKRMMYVVIGLMAVLVVFYIIMAKRYFG